MSNKQAVFRATYSEWKLVKTRQVVQVIFEVPLAEHDAAYQALGGMPDPAKERWFGIARLNPEKAQVGVSAPREAAEDQRTAEIAASRPRKPVAADKRLAQQAGIACADPMFMRFCSELCRRNGFREASVTTEEIAAAFVRTWCQVGSRSEIKVGTPEGDEWQKLYGEFLIWRDAPELAPADHQGERV